MHANNETGIIQPVKEIGYALQNSPAYFHIDAAQAFGKEVELAEIAFDLLSSSSHKIYGPQGIGALCVKRRGNTRIPISPMMHGGGQERGLRPGTVPVALAVGFGEASKLGKVEHQDRAEASRTAKDTFLIELKQIEHVVNGDSSNCQDHVVNIRFPGVDSEALMMALRELLAFSNGSACTSESYAASHVLLAMGLSEDEANESVRFSWGNAVKSIPCSQLIATAKHMNLNC